MTAPEIQVEVATVTVARLRWRAPSYATDTATRVRLFTRLADAQAAAERLRERGYEVELARAERTPWFVTRPATWSSLREVER